MMGEASTYNDITLLITHYNRPYSLKRLIEQFEHLNIAFFEIIVSDDGSSPENLNLLEQISNQHAIKLLKSATNKGLGNNINKGQDAVKTPFTLYVQEDFIPTQIFKEKLPIALMCMQNDDQIDLARFYAYFKYPSLTPLVGGFSKMHFKPLTFFSSYKKFYMYSDHPHLRKSNFFRRFGRYVEGEKGDKTEYKMMMSFLKNKGQAIFYDDYQSLFLQENSSGEPSTMVRSKLRNSPNIVITLLRNIYRHIKFNFDYFL